MFQEYLCYYIKLRKQRYLKFDAVQSALRFERVVYNFIIRKPLSHFKKIRLTLTNGGLPHRGRAFSPAFYKEREERMSANVHCLNHTINSLGYPYDPFACEHYVNEHYQCYDACLRKAVVQKLHRLPYTLFLRDKEKMSLISFSMMTDESISRGFSKMSDICYKKCPMYSCRYSYCITLARATTTLEHGVESLNISEYGTTVRVETTGQPDVSVSYQPKLPLLDFIIFILSSLGTWFGLVIISFKIHSITSNEF